MRRLAELAWTIALLAPVVGAQPYTVTDLGSLGGSSTATAINRSGQVVGYSDTSKPLVTHAFLWSHATGMQDLRTPGGNVSQAFGLNYRGLVVGGGNKKKNATTNPFVWTSATHFHLIGVNGEAQAINDNGQVTGTSGNDQLAFLWTKRSGTMSLGTLGGSSSVGYALNRSGQVVGYSLIDQSFYHAFLWTKANGMQDMGTLGGDNSLATGINDVGKIVGWAHLTGSVAYHAFLKKQGGPMQDLGTLGGTNSLSMGINNNGRVVGSSDLTGDNKIHAFVWTETLGMRDLNNLIPRNSDWELFSANAINGTGQIVGEGTVNGQIHAFLLTPVTPNR